MAGGRGLVGTGLPDGCGQSRITQNRHSTIHVYKYMLGVCKTSDIIFYFRLYSGTVIVHEKLIKHRRKV